ncbi:hypothetical protein PAP_08010 [Palaeococcus pacificus DY20341]|uniref:Uncharacterized protein n=2 Tax=Palaeococcus TaxID=83867 RepID=A0A075LV28_9EURY|nr:hypothetical protein PAP_08010 [Palaeococcus pacificus DY20341]
MINSEILVPQERYDSLVFIGIGSGEKIEFIKVYAEDKNKAIDLLNLFFYEQGIHPMDFLVVDQGFEDVSHKEIISTKTEEELSAYLSRMGLKLISNGVLYLQGKDSIYQLTAISKELYAKIKKQKGAKNGDAKKELKEIAPYFDLKSIPKEEVPEEYIKLFASLNLMQDVLIINEAEIDVEKVLKESIRGQVLIPRQIEIEEELLIRIFDREYHSEVASAVDQILVKTPMVYWDYYVDSISDFKFKKIEERIFSAPIFLKATKGFLILSDPPRELVKKLKRIKKRGYVKFRFRNKYHKIPVNFTLIVETTENPHHLNLNFPITLKLPKLDENTWSKLIKEEFGFDLNIADIRRIPRENRTMTAFKNLKILHRKLKEMYPEKDELELLRETIDIMIGEVK